MNATAILPPLAKPAPPETAENRNDRLYRALSELTATLSAQELDGRDAIVVLAGVMVGISDASGVSLQRVLVRHNRDARHIQKCQLPAAGAPTR